MSKIEVGKEYIVRGDTNKVRWASNGKMKKYIGTKVKVISLDIEPPYFKCCCNDNVIWWFNEEDLKLVEDNSKTITITTSDSTTTLTDGTHTTSINRYYTDKHDDMVALEEVVKKYKSEMEEISKPTKGKDLIGVYIPEGTKFRVINVEPHRRDSYVCLDEYIGKVATFNSRGFTFNDSWFHCSAIFEEDYMNAIDKKNGRFGWRYDEVEILWEEK